MGGTTPLGRAHNMVYKTKLFYCLLLVVCGSFLLAVLSWKRPTARKTARRITKRGAVIYSAIIGSYEAGSNPVPRTKPANMSIPCILLTDSKDMARRSREDGTKRGAVKFEVPWSQQDCPATTKPVVTSNDTCADALDLARRSDGLVCAIAKNPEREKCKMSKLKKFSIFWTIGRGVSIKEIVRNEMKRLTISPGLLNLTQSIYVTAKDYGPTWRRDLLSNNDSLPACLKRPDVECEDKIDVSNLVKLKDVTPWDDASW